MANKFIAAGKGPRIPSVDEVRFYTIAEVAESLAVSARTVRRWIKQKKLVAHYLGAAVRIAASDLNAFIDQHRSA